MTYSMTPEEIKAKVSLKGELERRGYKLFTAGGRKFKLVCPFHTEKTPSCSVDDEKGLFQCFGCKAAGSVIDLVMRLDGINFKTAVEKLGGTTGFSQPKQPTTPKSDKQIKAIYHYTDENGKDLYEVVRYEPKDFRQRHRNESGDWVWNMDGVTRVLYHLPEIIPAELVVLVEGEKDADSLRLLGYTASCNVGGAGKWLDGYTDALKGKAVVLCGDNDAPGREHVELVTKSIAGKVKTTQTIFPPASCKDVSDWIASFGDTTTAKAAIQAAIDNAPKLIQGVDLPIVSMVEMESEYIESLKTSESCCLTLNRWIPSLSDVRPLVPGEVVSFIADTGCGKTCVLQNLAIHARPLKTLMFEMELPNSLLFERFVTAAGQMPASMIESEYRSGQTWRPGIEAFLDHIYCCPRAGITVKEIERIISKAELKLGERPRLVLIDYVQLIRGDGKSRYERMSTVAEDLKTLAKTSQTIIVVSSQMSRKEDTEVGLHDAKDSGSIENSSGLVIGMWRPAADKLMMKILKNTKGNAGRKIECNFDGTTMRITESVATERSAK